VARRGAGGAGGAGGGGGGGGSTVYLTTFIVTTSVRETLY
jgi:hypothetical protein